MGRGATSFLLAALLAPLGAVAQSFHLMGFPDGYVASWARGVSADGSVSAGNSLRSDFLSDIGFTWTVASGRNDYGLLPGMPASTTAYGISGNGMVTVGTTGQAYRRVGAGPLQLLGVQAGYTYAYGIDANQDGSVVVGRSDAFGGNVSQAFRWTETTGLVGLGFTRTGHVRSEAMAISRDGTTIVGHSSSGQSDAFVWRQSTGMQMLTPLPGTGGYSTLAYGTNNDGSIIVGISGPSTSIATVWHDGVPTPLASPVGYGSPFAYAVNDTGSVIVGKMRSQTVLSTAFIWTPARGMEPLADYMAFNGITLPADVHLHTATGVSADGNTIVGYTGIPGTVGVQGFVVTIPAPATITLLLGLAALRRRR